MCPLEKGLGFSLGLGKVSRCPLDKICHLIHLGTGTAPIHPSPSHPPSSILKVSGTDDLYRWPVWASEKSLRGSAGGSPKATGVTVKIRFFCGSPQSCA